MPTGKRPRVSSPACCLPLVEAAARPYAPGRARPPSDGIVSALDSGPRHRDTRWPPGGRRVKTPKATSPMVVTIRSIESSPNVEQ